MLGIAFLIIAVLEVSLHLWFGSKRFQNAYVALTPLRLQAENNAPWTEEFAKEDPFAKDPEKWQDYEMFGFPEMHGRYVNVDGDSNRRTWNPAAGLTVTPVRSKRSVYVFGGSTAWGGGSRDDYTIPSDLSRILNGAGGSVDVENRAVPAYFSTQEVLWLMRQLRKGARPDVVVFLDGLNETLVPVYNGGHTGDALGRERRLRLAGDQTLPDALGYILRTSGIRRLASLLEDEPKKSGPGAADSSNVDPGDIARIYVSNADIVLALAAEYHFHPLFYWQPTIATKKTLSPLEEKTRPIAPSILENKPLFLAVSRKVKALMSADADFRDIENIFDDSPATIYNDNAHYTEEANRRIALLMSADVMRLLRRSGRSSLGSSTR